MNSVPEPPTAPPPWGLRSLDSQGVVALRIGPRDFWLQARDGEIWVAHSAPPPLAEGSTDPSLLPALETEPPEGVDWARWATPGGETEISFRPAFPERPLVLQPERPFRLLSGASARVFVRVPLQIRLELQLGDREQPHLLAEFPSISMSDTWWGDVMDGELAWWLPTSARREIRPELHQPHLAVCPLHLTNRSGADLAVDKLAFRVVHLSLFRHGTELWSDESRVVYQGNTEGSRIDMSGAPPPEAPEASLVVPPRIRSQKGFRARTFHRLMSLSGAGGS